MTLPKTPSFRLDGKRALVAGASSGIGLGCAAALAEAGAAVTLAARSEDRLTAIASEFDAAGYASKILAMDVGDIHGTADKVEANGPFEILVNSAGFAKHRPSVETLESEFDAMTDLNAKGAYFLTQAVAKGLIKAGKSGSLINISSQMAHVGGQERAVYCGTKHALEGYTKAWAIEWGQYGIRANTICPTFVRTPLTEQTFARPEMTEWVLSKIKLGRIADVEDMMGAVLFLASDASAMVTGTSILIDGGWTAD